MIFGKSAVILLTILCLYCSNSAETTYLETAEQAAEWISSTAVHEGEVLFWPAQPDTMQRGEVSLYHGVPGGVLFFLELYKVTGNSEYLTECRQAAEWLITRANHTEDGSFWSGYVKDGKPVPDAGLYTGTAGVGTVLLELGEHLDDNRYSSLASKAADWLTFNINGNGAWNPVTDIVSGAAGTGLFLLKAAKELNNPEYIRTAVKTGDFLIANAIDDPPGRKWSAFPNSTRIYPNFSHGTAGIAFFLARLYEETNDKRFLDKALEGAEWLVEHETEHFGEGHAWYHHEPDGKDLYYVSWCHGPGGTARLFYQLYLVTEEQKWLGYVKESAKWLMTCGLNERDIEGYWNVSACCGNAGIADFLADVYRLTGDRVYFDYAKLIMDDSMKKAVPGNPGIKFMIAENRTSPDVEYAQTGWAQGASGMGLTFLKLHAYGQKTPPFDVLVLPDNPFTF